MKSETQNSSPNTISIERCPHDKANPYTMVRNELIRDASISPACRWLLIYLLSNDEKVWTIKVSQIITHLKGMVGKNAVYRLFNEAIEAGYMKRHNYLIDNMKRSKYIVSETPKFKKIPLLLRNGEAETEDTENRDALEGTSQQSLSKESLYNNPPLSSPPKSLPKKSLRSEEEDVSIFDFLEGTSLSPKEKLRLSRDFTREEVLRALKISEKQRIKKTLMHLLISILKNPDSWPDASETQLETHQQRIASSYNESLRKSKKLGYEAVMKPGKKTRDSKTSVDIAKENDETIKVNHMNVILDGFITRVSLSSSDFEQDIKHAIAQLR